ncbi:MAG: aminotransferase class V-fold PLP-dependent enzyme [Acidimicrobiales bacterium]|nr:aminotransferase class V-fold PLP-dependent enzyme [Acidimicrobiales bacterium]
MSRIYLDSASVAPLRSAAKEAVLAGLNLPTADPGRLHTEAMEVRAHLEHAREQVAVLLGARPSEIIFNSSASEGIATVVKGMLSTSPDGVVVGTAVEHSAVRLSAGDSFVPVPVTGEGLVTVDALRQTLADQTRVGRPIVLLALQLGNHEMGAVQPIANLLNVARDVRIATLVDAAQAAPWRTIDVRSLEPNYLTISGPKLGAPLGTGALMVQRGQRTAPFIMGGAQERGRRAGLENVPAAMGLGAACDELAESIQREIDHVSALTLMLRDGLADLDGVTLFGPEAPEHRLPHLVCCGLDRIEPQAVLIDLDRAGIAAHSGSACASEELEPSPVLAAMGVDADRSLRFSLHRHSTMADVQRVLDVLPGSLARLRAL